MLFKNRDNKSAYDMLVVGLGNPGKEYEGTRHNVGFAVIDAFCDKHGVGDMRLKNKALICECRIDDKRIMIAKPQTFMNLSGESVGEICRFYKIPTDSVVIVFDDISLPVGKIRIRRNGTHGGHNGMKNISAHLSSDEIKRVKVGVGQKPNPEYDLKDWVLGKFPQSDKAALQKAIDNAVCAVEEIIINGVDSAMNKYSNK